MASRYLRVRRGMYGAILKSGKEWSSLRLETSAIVQVGMETLVLTQLGHHGNL